MLLCHQGIRCNLQRLLMIPVLGHLCMINDRLGLTAVRSLAMLHCLLYRNARTKQQWLNNKSLSSQLLTRDLPQLTPTLPHLCRLLFSPLVALRQGCHLACRNTMQEQALRHDCTCTRCWWTSVRCCQPLLASSLEVCVDLHPCARESITADHCSNMALVRVSSCSSSCRLIAVAMLCLLLVPLSMTPTM